MEGKGVVDWLGSEDDFQICVARYLDALNLNWFHTPNGGLRNVVVASRLKKMGTKKGAPDILIFNPTRTGYAGLAIELKVAKRKQTDEQKEWEIKLINANWVYVLAYSLDTVIEAVKDHYNK